MGIIIYDMDIPVWPIEIFGLVLVLANLWHRKHTFSYLFFFAIFWMYVMSCLNKVFFPIQINGEYVDVMRQMPIMSQVNPMPFFLNQYQLPTAGLASMINNIVLTVPFGFGVNFVSRIRTKDFLWLSVAIGIGLEIIQFVISLALRYPYRVVDINDAIMNAVGVLVGYGLFRVFAWLYLALTNWLKIEHSGLSSFVYNVACQSQTTENMIW